MRLTNRLKLNITIALLILILPGCFNNKLRNPQREIERPLSLPSTNWQVGVSAGALFTVKQIGPPAIAISPIFQYPYFQFGPNFEYHIPAFIKYYLIKNIIVQDSQICITNSNLAISAGVTGIGYSARNGFGLEYSSLLQFKKPISDKIWISSNLLANYFRFDSYAYGLGENLQIGFGYQTTKSFYAMLGSAIAHSKFTEINSINDTIFTIKDFLDVPLTLGFNSSRKWTIILTNSAIYDFTDEIDLNSGLEIIFTW